MGYIFMLESAVGGSAETSLRALGPGEEREWFDGDPVRL